MTASIILKICSHKVIQIMSMQRFASQNPRTYRGICGDSRKYRRICGPANNPVEGTEYSPLFAANLGPE